MNSLRTFFYSFKRSLFDPKYYKDIAKVSFWFSYKYLWFLLFIFIFINTLFLSTQYLNFRPKIKPAVDNFVKYAETFYPADLELKVKNGQLTTNVKEPYIFDLEKKSSKHFLIIDTKGSIEEYPNYNAYVLATKNAIVYPSESSKNQISQTSVFYFNELKKDFTINKKAYDNILNIAKPYTSKAVFYVDTFTAIVLVLFLLFGSLFWAGSILFGLLFMTFIAWIVNLIFKRNYTYKALFKMGMHAVTWPIIITEVLKYFSLTVPFAFVISFFIMIFIVIFS